MATLSTHVLDTARGRPAVDGGDDVGPPGRDDVDLRRPAERAHLLDHELGRRFLVEAARGVVHARDAYEFPGELHERLAVDRHGRDITSTRHDRRARSVRRTA